MLVSENDWLAHEGRSKRDGAPIGSGRYPLGSGENPYQDYRDFRNRVAQIKKSNKGIKEKELVKYLFEDGYTDEEGHQLSIRKYRAMITKSKAETAQQDYLEAKKLKDRGWSDQAIGEKIGYSASGVRGLLKRDADSKAKRINSTAEMLRESLDKRGGFIDIGSDSELWVGVGRSNFDAAIKELHDEGYAVINFPVQQLFGQGNTTVKVLCPPGTTKADVWNNLSDIRLPVDVHVDPDGNPAPLRPIENVNSKRIQINYAETGGVDKDGVIELRRGVKDLDLGNASYAQVRIGVDGTHYLKGMAVYADDLPDGIDIRFNTNKHEGTPLHDVLKPMKDPSNLENPFGASIKAYGQRGALNIVNEEGDWSKWSKTLAAQFLSKQYVSTAKRQLKATADVANAEFEELKSLTNPTVKRYLLKEFADGCDADAVHLKAIRLPGQTQKVLLPLPDNKPNQCYCPSLPDGTEVALVRYPHGGVFEIPVVTVNNKNPKAAKIMGNAKDAIGIHPSQAGVLSGADFDGDTVMVLPLTGSFKLRKKEPLKDLKGFDPKTQFDGSHLQPKDLMKKSNVQQQMGSISNLITDMTIQGADDKELARAVAHSMVVIDAYKHKLDYKSSEKYFGIAELRAKYQPQGGASTIFSRAKSPQFYNERREKAVGKLTPEERKRWEQGEIIYEPTGKTLWSGKLARSKGTKMGETKDAYELSSGSVMESYYADYANQMKALANKARAEMRATGKLEYSPSAYETYKPEVKTLKAKLERARMNSPLERKAQTLANSTWNVEKADHPEYTKEDAKKAKSRHLAAARAAVGAGKDRVEITDREWEAIQAGAVHDSTLLRILSNSKPEVLKERAMPRGTSVAPAKIARARSMRASGNYTWSEIAEILGVSVTTLQKELD